MKLGMVAACLNTPHIRGMGRYVQELLRQSHADPAVTWRLYADNPALPMALAGPARATQDIFTFRGDRFHFWEQIGLPLHARRDGVDLLHCTEGTLCWWQPVPTVVTVHDTLAWEEPQATATERFFYHRVLPRALHKAAAVVTISESSRRDILARWPRLAAKVSVIPHGIADEYLDAADQPRPSDTQQSLAGAPYLVYLGGPMERKRFDWALQVLEGCQWPALRLVACGFGEAARQAQAARLPKALAERVLFAPFLSDEALRALYKGCVAVLYPTLYEGFGFPAVEAQSVGAPAIFSPVSSLAELVGPLAWTPQPMDLAGWCAAVHEAAAMGERRQHLAASARAWAQTFSWRRSWESHRAVYSRVLDGVSR